MLIALFERIGESNPQLFREIKGRFITRNLWVTFLSSSIGQFLLLLSCSKQTCISYNDGECAQVNWEFHWQIIYRLLNWVLPILLITNGVYALINDVAQEERKGTLNFIRFSPQSSQTILLGKILGVPSLLYLGIALAIGLHLGSGLVAGLPLSSMLGIYALWAVGCALFYNSALLYTLQHSDKMEAKTLAGGGCLLAFLVGLAYVGTIDFAVDWYNLKLIQCLTPASGNNSLDYCQTNGLNWQWFFLPIGNQPVFAYGLAFISLSIAAYWYWQAVNRRFRSRGITLISKLQSYKLVASFELWLLGFSLPELKTIVTNNDLGVGFGLLFFVTPILLIIIAVNLTPSYQALLDWSRYKHLEFKGRKYSLWRDLIWGEKSPAIVAVALNLLITALIWLPWMLLWLQKERSENVQTPQLLLGWFMTMNVILIYVAIAELLRLTKTPTWLIFASTALSTIVLTVGAIFALAENKLPIVQFLLLFSPFPIVSLGFGVTAITFLGLVTQLVTLSLLTWQLTRKVQTIGASSSQSYLSASP
ncbi:MAG TPA: hypothetical protein DDW76_23570 [Cyanobacteria bacterium UBA11369]|nr:hypothetical protein [Cyanobacteria bacterium UBA11371]HBE32253.1 hypothetical protein [Cyanobacteria bacterium UBA11368]HBE51672.1 hypothetical protein [Cyanobacteria bacterium UBA11369]